MEIVESVDRQCYMVIQEALWTGRGSLRGGSNPLCWVYSGSWKATESRNLNKLNVVDTVLDSIFIREEGESVSAK